MPVKFIEQTARGLVGFWETTESAEEMLQQLKPIQPELETYLLFRNERRKKEWLAARLLLKEMVGHHATLSYNVAGKPVPDNFEGHLSISHSAGYVTICYHPARQPGIDIESINRDTEKAAAKFLSPKELADCTINNHLSNRELLLRWCAKEAVFKMVPWSNIDFSEQIAVEADLLSEKGGELSATFTHQGTTLRIALIYRITDSILMVWGTI